MPPAPRRRGRFAFWLLSAALLFTGDLIEGSQAVEWGLAIEAPAAARLDERFEALVERIALTRSTSS